MTLPALPVGSVTAPSFEADPLAWAIHWLTTNRGIYMEFERLVTERIAAQPDARISADAVLHVVRWNTGLREDGSTWKVNNSASSLCARVLIGRNPDAKRHFELRHSWLDDLTPSQKWQLVHAVDNLTNPVVEQPVLLAAEKARRW